MSIDYTFPEGGWVAAKFDTWIAAEVHFRD